MAEVKLPSQVEHPGCGSGDPNAECRHYNKRSGCKLGPRCLFMHRRRCIECNVSTGDAKYKLCKFHHSQKMRFEDGHLGLRWSKRHFLARAKKLQRLDQVGMMKGYASPEEIKVYNATMRVYGPNECFVVELAKALVDNDEKLHTFLCEQRDHHVVDVKPESIKDQPGEVVVDIAPVAHPAVDSRFFGLDSWDSHPFFAS